MLPYSDPNSEYIEVVCVVFPTGSTVWFEASRGSDFMRDVIDVWRAEHPEFIDTVCTMGAVNIVMPRSVYAAFSNPIP